MDDKEVPEYLTRKDLRSLGVNDNFRDELVIDFNDVKTKKESGVYFYYLPDLMKSVIFRLGLIQNHAKLKKLPLTDDLKRQLKSYQYEDRFWLEQIHIRSFQDRFVALQNDKLAKVLASLKDFYGKYNGEGAAWNHFYQKHANLLNFIEKLSNEGQVVAFDSKFDSNPFAHEALKDYNRQLGAMLYDLKDMASFSKIFNKPAAMSDLETMIDKNSAFYNYAGDLSDVELKIVKRLRLMLSKDLKFEKEYQKLVDKNFSLKNAGLYYSFNDLDELKDGQPSVDIDKLKKDVQDVKRPEISRENPFEKAIKEQTNSMINFPLEDDDNLPDINTLTVDTLMDVNNDLDQQVSKDPKQASLDFLNKKESGDNKHE